MTVWRSIPKFEDYEASDCGRIRRVKKSTGDKNRGKKVPFFVKQSLNGSGYFVVQLQSSKGWVPVRVNRAVALAFLGESKDREKAYVAHNDGNPRNNRVSNLRWATPRENSADTLKHGTRNSGSRNGFSRLKDDDVLAIRAMRKAGAPYTKIAAKFSINPQTASDISNRKTWGHIPP